MEFKCKMCGGVLTAQPDEKIVACVYCGTKQTVPQSEEAMQKEIDVLAAEPEKKEKPVNHDGVVDIFICYKETDRQGRRTVDSLLAADIYEKLSASGYEVFYAPMVPADKIGEEYDAYVAKALETAKIMIVLGTKQEHFNDQWVKEEWSRFLSLIANGEKKVLIPAYKEMNPYDMPKEFVHLQAINMNELGFQQDLLQGIAKIIPKEKSVSGKREEERLKLYKDTIYKMDNTLFPEVLRECIEVFDSLGYYADCKERKEACLKKIERIEKEKREAQNANRRRNAYKERQLFNDTEGVPEKLPEEKNDPGAWGVLIGGIVVGIIIVVLSNMFGKYW